MLPIEPNEKLRQQYPNLRPVNMHSPKDVPEEECGSLVALVGSLLGGPYDGYPIIRTFWKLSDEELEILKSGGVIELDFYDRGMPMTAMNVETLE